MKKIIFFYLFLLLGIGMQHAQTKKTIKIMAVGDIMMGTTFPSRAYLPAKETNPFKNVLDIFSTSDVLFGNLEGTLTDTGKNAKRCKDPSKCYSFKSPEKYGNYLKKVGFDVVSIANNHIGDFGKIGIKNTRKVLENLDINYAGILAKKHTVFTKDSVKYGFIAVAPNNDCFKLNNTKEIVKLIKELKTKSDIVMVSFHGGAEGLKHKNVPKKSEIFYGENRGNVYKSAHQFVDAGADIILGHGPHVPRAIEVYKNKLIAYSLGNFFTYKRFSLTGSKGYSPILEFEVDSSGNFIKGKIHSAKQIKGKYPLMDLENNAFREIKKLTQQDFKNSKIVFKNDQTFHVQH